MFYVILVYFDSFFFLSNFDYFLDQFGRKSKINFVGNQGIQKKRISYRRDFILASKETSLEKLSILQVSLL